MEVLKQNPDAYADGTRIYKLDEIDTTKHVEKPVKVSSPKGEEKSWKSESQLLLCVASLVKVEKHCILLWYSPEKNYYLK